MFAKVERVDFSVSKHGRALDPMKYLPSSYVFVSQKRAVLYQRFICAKEGGGLQILDKITGTRVGCESF